MSGKDAKVLVAIQLKDQYGAQQQQNDSTVNMKPLCQQIPHLQSTPKLYG